MNQEFIENTIINLCYHRRNFTEIAKSLYGLDPLLLNEYLLNLQKSKRLKKVDGDWVVYSYRTSQKKSNNENSAISLTTEVLRNKIPYFELFKKPHPLDYEWRNSFRTLDFLVNFILANNNKKDNILLLGMPSLFISSFYRKVQNEITLVDRNVPLLKEIEKITSRNKKFTIIQKDIFTVSPVSLGSFNSVFIDPPWYSPHFFHFIWLAAQCLKTGGFLAVSLPPLNTRPGVAQEREEWFALCQKQGLYLESLNIQTLEYIMPFFEFNALRAAGIGDITPFWRHGDFAVFRKIENNVIDRPVTNYKENIWAELEIESVRFRVNLEDFQEGEFCLSHIIPGDILPTVSSRDNRRKQANIWTSGNRVFKTNNPKLFLNLAEIYKNKKNSSAKDFKFIAEFLDFIIEIETKEYNNYSDWISYEMEN